MREYANFSDTDMEVAVVVAATAPLGITAVRFFRSALAVLLHHLER